MNTNNILGYIVFAAAGIIALITSVKDFQYSKGYKEKRYVLIANGILWTSLLLAAVFLHINAFFGILIYYLATQHIQRKRLDIRLDEGMQEFRDKMKPQQSVPGYPPQGVGSPEP